MKIKKYPPIHQKLPVLWHGADYNPEQWLHDRDILLEDIRLMKLSGINTVSLGIFAWAALEPEEGSFRFHWLDEIMDTLHENGIHVILATPSAGKPQWLMNQYPEVMLVAWDRQRKLPGQRVNHCYTSPVFREKVAIINRKLAERYGNHPTLILWHISNELSYECHCELCQERFRQWLKERYGNLDSLNLAWWTAFWSHTYTEWSQIQSPAPHGENVVHGHSLDWKRFVTHCHTEHLRWEAMPLKELSAHIPITTNFMGIDIRYDQKKLAEVLDIISWDMYPGWHEAGMENDWLIASEIAFNHDQNRCLKDGKPYLLMETTPSVTNWMEAGKQKRPGVHSLTCMQAIAHGAEGVCYFQWRKGRGGFEKFHGAIVDHCGHENTKVFREVSEVSKILGKLHEITGTVVPTEVAIIVDWDSRVALEESSGPRRNKDFMKTCMEHYRQFWKRGIPVDVLNDSLSDLSGYKIVIAPMLYLIKSGFQEKIEAFVRNGGTFVATYWTGIVNETDLCFLGGFPGPLRSLLGVWSEEVDCLHPNDSNAIIIEDDCPMPLCKEYGTGFICDVIHAETAAVLARYKEDYYQGSPALTVNRFGKGEAYYLASRFEESLLSDFYGQLAAKLSLIRALGVDLPEGVTAQLRTDGVWEYVFLMNFNPVEKEVQLGSSQYFSMLEDANVEGKVTVKRYGMKILQCMLEEM